MRRLGVLLATTAAVAAMLAPTASATSTRAEYTVEVNLICEGAEEDLYKTLGPLFKGNFIGFLDRYYDVFEKVTEEIALVPAAPGDELLVAGWVTDLREIARLSDAALPLLRRYFGAVKADRKPYGKKVKVLGKKVKKRGKEIDPFIDRARAVGGELGASACTGRDSILGL